MIINSRTRRAKLAVFVPLSMLNTMGILNDAHELWKYDHGYVKISIHQIVKTQHVMWSQFGYERSQKVCDIFFGFRIQHFLHLGA